MGTRQYMLEEENLWTFGLSVSRRYINLESYLLGRPLNQEPTAQDFKIWLFGFAHRFLRPRGEVQPAT